MAKYTPMMEQYLAIKQEVQDAFLFFRLGDFYEMFFEDALLASKELEITLTGREGGAEERIPMCGVPHHSADSYITRLIEKGYKVAICEQVEDPALAKGIVRREIIRIITPGTVMDGKTIGAAANNFMVSLAQSEGREEFALTACDLTTGELYTASSMSFEQIVDEAAVYQPSEMIGAEELLNRAEPAIQGWSKPVVRTGWSRSGDELLAGRFGAGQVEALSEASRRSVSFMLSYLNETQKRSLTHLTHIRAYLLDQFMVLDPFTRRNLELAETVRDRSRKGTLLWLLDRTATSMGGRLLRRWLDKPLLQIAAIERRQEAVDKLHGQLIVREELRQELDEAYDLERLAGRIAYGSANGRDLLALKATLEHVPAIARIALESGSRTLRSLVDGLDDCSEIRQWISEAIADEPPVSIKDGGLIRAGYHAYLDQLREAGKSGKQWLAELERKEREATGIRSLKLGYNKVFGYYIEVTKANLAALPEGRYERKQTLANAERFVTPELKEQEALILEAEEKTVGLEYELFVELRDKLAGQIARLQRLSDILAEIDVYQSFAAVSAANRYRKPQMHEGCEMSIKSGRHPVVEAVMGDTSFISNDTALSADGGSMLLITGPNMAGKSTYMRQVAMIVIMAQIGCFVPADEALLPLVDRIFTRIGAADDLITGDSTFMVEMKDIRIMTEKATKNSLVIIDELGRGTSTSEGMSIAQAVIEFLHNRIGCKTLVSTHFHELAHLDGTLANLRNCCMAVKESGDRVTFLRKLVPGAASTSYGIYCARIAGLPQGIIDRAYELLTGYDSRAEEPAAAPAAVAAAAAVAVSPGGGSAGDAEGLAASPGLGLGGANSVKPDAAAHRAEAPVVQLDLFGEAAPSEGRGKKANNRADQVIDALKQADLMNMTPLDAMNFIYNLKQKAAQC